MQLSDYANRHGAKWSRLSLALSIATCILVLFSLTYLSVRPAAAQDLLPAPDAPENIEWVSQIGGSARALDVKGNLAIMSQGSHVAVFDTEAETGVELLGKTRALPGEITDILVAGQYAYVMTSGVSGCDVFTIVDLSIVTAPTVMSSLCVSDGYGGNINIIGNDSILLPGGDIVDISDPSTPLIKDWGSFARDTTEIRGQFAYQISLSYSGPPLSINGKFSIFDVEDYQSGVQNPDASIVGTLVFTGTQLLDIEVANNLVYLITNRSSLLVVDVSLPEAPTQISELCCFSYIFGQRAEIQAVDGLLFITTDHESCSLLGEDNTPYCGALTIVDARDAENFREVSTTLTVGRLFDLKVKDAMVYASGEDGLSVFDVTTPLAPSLSKQYRVPRGEVVDLKVIGERAYVLTAFGEDVDIYTGEEIVKHTELSILDISTKTSPKKIGEYFPDAEAGDPVGLEVIGEFAYVLSRNRDENGRLTVANVSVPESIAYEADFYLAYKPVDLDIDQDQVFSLFAGRSHFSPTLRIDGGIGVIDTSSLWTSERFVRIAPQGKAIDVDFPYAYVVGDSLAYIYSLENPDDPSQIYPNNLGRLEELEGGSDIDVEDGVAFVAGPYTDEMSTYSVANTNRSAPPLLDSLLLVESPSPNSSNNKLVVESSLAYVARQSECATWRNDVGTIHVVDGHVPTNLIIAGRYPIPNCFPSSDMPGAELESQLNNIDVDNGTIYIAGGNGGVHILQFTGGTESLELDKAYEISSAEPSLVLGTITVTTKSGISAVVLTDTLPSGMTLLRDTLASTRPGITADGHCEQLICWEGQLSPSDSLVITYRARIDASVEPGSVLGSEVVMLTGTGEHYVVSASVAVRDSDFAGALMLIYIAADTAEDGFNVGRGDLSDQALELLNRAETVADTSGVKTILMLDGPGPDDARIYNLHQDLDRSCPNFQNPLCTDRDNPYVEGVNTFKWGDSTANPTSVSEFAASAIRAHPNAEVVLLSLVGHGGGWTPQLLKGQPTKRGGQPTKRGGQPTEHLAEMQGGLLWDTHRSDALSTADLRDALYLISQASGRKVDLLYLDACLMAMSEVALEIHESANLLLASQSWSWTTFSYDRHIASVGEILDHNNDINSETVPALIGEAWIDNEVGVLSEEDNYPFTYSLLDLRRIPALRDAENHLAESLISLLVNDETAEETRTRLGNAFELTECVDSDQSGRIEHDSLIGWTDNYCDLGSFAKAIRLEFFDNPVVVRAADQLVNMLDTGVEQGAVLENAFQSGTPHTYSDLPWTWGNLTGLSRYLPIKQDDWRRRYYNDLFLPSSKTSLWDELLTAYWGSDVPDTTVFPDPTCPEEGCVFPPVPLGVFDIDASAVLGSDGVSIEWWVTPETSSIKEFELYRVLLPQTTSPEMLTVIPRSSAVDRQRYVFIDTTVNANTLATPCYQVVARSEAGGVLASSKFYCAIGEPSSEEIAVVLAVVAIQDGSITLTWDPPIVSSSYSEASAGYLVYRSVNRGQWNIHSQGLITTTTYVDKAVVPRTEYCYMVIGITESGEILNRSEKACTVIGDSPSYNFLPIIRDRSSEN